MTVVMSFLFFLDGLSSGERVGGGVFDKQSWNKMLRSAGWLRIQATSLSVRAGSVSHCTEGPLVADVAAPVAGDKATTFPPLFHLVSCWQWWAYAPLMVQQRDPEWEDKLPTWWMASLAFEPSSTA